ALRAPDPYSIGPTCSPPWPPASPRLPSSWAPPTPPPGYTRIPLGQRLSAADHTPHTTSQAPVHSLWCPLTGAQLLERGDGGDLLLPQVVPDDACGATPWWAVDAPLGGDDQVHAHVVVGLGDGFVDDLESVDGGDDEGVIGDEPLMGEQAHFDVGVPRALANTHTLVIDRDTAADDHVHRAHPVRTGARHMFGCTRPRDSDISGHGVGIDEVEGVGTGDLRYRHVQQLARAHRGETDLGLSLVRVGLDDPGGLPPRVCGQVFGCLVGALEIRDLPTHRAGAADARGVKTRPHLLPQPVLVLSGLVGGHGALSGEQVDEQILNIGYNRCGSPGCEFSDGGGDQGCGSATVRAVSGVHGVLKG